MYLSNATCLFPFAVPLAQLRVFKAKASEEFHAWKIKQKATVLRVDKHKYLEVRSARIGSTSQKQNVVCAAEKKKFKLCNPDKKYIFCLNSKDYPCKRVSLVCWNRTKKKSLSIHCFQKFLFVSGTPQSTQAVCHLWQGSHLSSRVPVSAPESLKPGSCQLVPF